MIGRNRRERRRAGLHLHATPVVRETGLPLGVLRAKLDAPKSPRDRRHAELLLKRIALPRGPSALRRGSRSLAGVPVPPPAPTWTGTDFYPLVRLATSVSGPRCARVAVRASRIGCFPGRPSKAGGKSWPHRNPEQSPAEAVSGSLRSAPVRAWMLLKVKRQSARIKASKQAARPRRLARVARMELRYETLTRFRAPAR